MVASKDIGAVKPVRIVLYGNFGSGNLGNECTLQTAIEHIGQRWPNAQLQCICTVPEDVEMRHRIPAFRSDARGSRWTWAALESPNAEAKRGRGEQRQVGGRLPAKIIRLLFRRLPLECVHWLQSLHVIKQSDMLLVPGTGIVTDDGCGPFRYPYEIFKLSSLAALCRVKITFLSVGVGPIRTQLGRWFLKRGLGLAHYRSYRDEDSKRCAESIGIKTYRDAVRPDLAFALQHPKFETDMAEVNRRRIVGLGLKDYSSELIGTNSYRDYLDTMAVFVSWLQDHEYSVRLLIGDVQYDTRVRRDLIELLDRRGVSGQRRHVRVEEALTVQELLRQLSGTDIVISPRFHNLVLALTLNKPVLALSDLPKVDALMLELGLPQYCMRLERLTATSLIRQFQELESDANRVKRHIKAEVAKYRVALEEQYASVFAPT